MFFVCLHEKYLLPYSGLPLKKFKSQEGCQMILFLEGWVQKWPFQEGYNIFSKGRHAKNMHFKRIDFQKMLFH
jgi:hypothetical protein